ncbi:MAG TPA: 4-hydroxythreonine-4-phosphate dehydrogenase PdxA [Candidatus Cloacimonadota bacterium]|nr:4-hydroxythreonine-4-phosphate dehydrogenase PdxA [Candidatus Cloacimonadota bacterium]
MRKIAITTGDPAGIGTEITAKALRFMPLRDNIILIVYGKLEHFSDGNKVEKIENIQQAVHPKVIYWIEIDDPGVKIGVPSKLSGQVAYDILQRCAIDLKLRKLDAVVTCPVSKEAIQHNHPDFIGHTEFFAASSKSDDVIMSFWGPHFNLALLTTHLAIKNVPIKLTPDEVERKLRFIYKEFSSHIDTPRLAMVAINPHAGENSAFGNEDEMLTEILDKLKSENICIDGPFPSDTFFAHQARNYDVVISAFHDQGLIPFKMVSNEEGVNVTLGLPYIRTSVDHGTAFDIAGKNIASEKSLLSAIDFAIYLLNPHAYEINNNYANFAAYYDQYMGHVNYEEWVSYILGEFHKRHNSNPQRILEMACGTANISCLLVKKGLKVDASDLSEEMLKIASHKRFRPHLFQRDMLELLPAEKYDLVLLLFDSINYLLERKQIRKMLNNVYITLQKGGIFIFDITTVKNCEQNFDGFVNLEDEEDSYLIHQSDYDKEESLQLTKLTFFKKKGFLFERFDEVHQQRIYNVTDLIEMIESTQFKLAAIHSIGFPDNLLKSDLRQLDKNFTRLFFVLEKK